MQEGSDPNSVQNTGEPTGESSTIENKSQESTSTVEEGSVLTTHETNNNSNNDTNTNVIIGDNNKQDNITETNNSEQNTTTPPADTNITKDEINTSNTTTTTTSDNNNNNINNNKKEEVERPSSPPVAEPIPAALTVRDHIFDHFIVAGIPPYAQAKRGQFLKPEVLYQFPADKPVPPKVAEFCFPNGIKISSVKRSASGSSLNELLFGQPHLHSASNSHVFYLTGEFETMYGCCVTKDEFLRCTPNFLQASMQSHPLPQLPQYLTAPRCYCFLSRFPIFPMHFDVLFALLAQDRLITITLESQAQVSPPSSPLPSPLPSPSFPSPSETKIDSSSSNNNSNLSSTTPPYTSPNPSASPISTSSVSSASSGDDSMENLDVTFQKRLSISGELFTEQMFKFTYARELYDILDYYYKQNVLQPGQSVLLKIPGDIKKHTTFYCPMAPSLYEAGTLQLADWCLTPLFKHLSLDNILKIFAAALLEHKLIFLCENLNTLSAVVLSIIPLLYPFVWQGIYIPVLPINLHEYLDAPVPFIMGLQSLRRRNLEAIIVDLNANKLIFDNCSQPVAMPEYKKLYYNLEASHKILFDVNNKNHNPFNNTGKMLAAVHNIVHTLQAYIFWLIKKIEDFFNANPAEISDSLSVEGFKQKFINTVSGPNKEFVRQFMDTQLFSFYMHSHMGPSAPKGKRVALG